MSGYTSTPNFALKKPVTGADDDMWGTHWNQNADTLDSTLKQHADSIAAGGGGGTGGGGVTKTDRSGAIALGGQAQTLMAANATRKGWSFQNKSNANIWFNDLGGTADPTANNATYLPPGAYYESEPGGASVAAISLIGDATGAQFAAREW